jgi:hypothetical protein
MNTFRPAEEMWVDQGNAGRTNTHQYETTCNGFILLLMVVVMTESVVPQMWQFVPFAREGLAECIERLMQFSRAPGTS